MAFRVRNLLMLMAFSLFTTASFADEMHSAKHFDHMDNGYPCVAAPLPVETMPQFGEMPKVVH